MHLPFPAMRLPQCEGYLVRAALAAAKARGKQLRTPKKRRQRSSLPTY
jgi:hypothetical protein